MAKLERREREIIKTISGDIKFCLECDNMLDNNGNCRVCNAPEPGEIQDNESSDILKCPHCGEVAIRQWFTDGIVRCYNCNKMSEYIKWFENDENRRKKL